MLLVALPAFAGLSMGGITTSNMYMNHPEDFSCFGVWSAANTKIEDFTDGLKNLPTHPNVMVAGGAWDFGLKSVLELADKLMIQVGVNPVRLVVPVAHDWETWQMIYAYAAENFFWK